MIPGREMKKLSAMPLLLLLLLHFILAATATTISPSSPSPTVIIIGAGMSGMTAARTLHEAGITDILILEATDRIGGRLMKTEFSGHVIELGGNWIFGGGPVANPVLEIANKLNLRTVLSDYDNATANTYKQDGGLYPKEMVDKIDAVATARDDFCDKFARKLSKKKQEIDLSIFAAQSLNSSVPKTPLEMVIDFFHNDFEDTEPPKSTSLVHTYPRNEIEDHGENEYFVSDPRGFEIVVKYIAKQFLSSLTSDPRLKLNKAVEKITYSDNGVTVKTEDGSTYSSKYVIVSASLGVLQSGLIKFEPELPLMKRIAIADFHMTIYTKIFLKFPYTFWPIGNGTEFFLYTHVRRGYYPIWQHLNNEYPGSNMLFATLTADESRRVEQMTNKEIEAEIMEILRIMFGENIPNPEAILVPRWGMSKYYKGSYSNWPPNYTQERKDQLVEPVGPVYFTGEHCSEKYIGYADGAYLAGVDTANVLLNCINENNCTKTSRHT